MLKEEALEVFKDKYLPSEIKDLRERVDIYIKTNYESIEGDILNSFKLICNKVKKAQDEENKMYISFINYSILRTEILNDKCRCLISAYDSNYYLDEKPVEAYYDASWLFKHINSFYDKTLNISKKFVGKISRVDMLKLKFDVLEIYKTYLIAALRNAFENIEDLAEFKEMKKNERFSIQVGEYIDFVESVFLLDEAIKDDVDTKLKLEKEEELGSTNEYFNRLDISNGKFSEKNISNTRFINCEIQNSDISYSIMIGTNFKNCNMQNVDFEESILWCSNFNGSDLSGSNFFNVNKKFVMDKKIFDIPINKPISFKKANLTNCNMSNANLVCSNFIEAKLENINFEGANLEGAKIDKKYQDILNLTEEQKLGILWL